MKTTEPTRTFEQTAAEKKLTVRETNSMWNLCTAVADPDSADLFSEVFRNALVALVHSAPFTIVTKDDIRGFWPSETRVMGKETFIVLCVEAKGREYMMGSYVTDCWNDWANSGDAIVFEGNTSFASFEPAAV